MKRKSVGERLFVLLVPYLSPKMHNGCLETVWEEANCFCVSFNVLINHGTIIISQTFYEIIFDGGFGTRQRYLNFKS